MKKQHKSPCGECPFRRKSAPGWLGEAEPEEFMRTADSETRMPCHMHVNYEDPNWRDTIDQAPQCAGRAIHQANRCKLPIDKTLLRLPPDHKLVFDWPFEFLDHHNQFKPGKHRMQGRKDEDQS